MELTNILGQAFLVNVDSVVYAYTRGSGATLVMSRNKELVYVTESVSEVVTASGTGLVAFTSTEGDVTGSAAINPNYIQTVTSVDGGDSSGLILGDNSGVRATLVVTTDYSEMDAIVEASASSASYLLYTALLSQSGTDAPVATVLENTLGGTVVWTREDDGQYRGTLSGAFPFETTVIFMMNTSGSLASQLTAFPADGDSVLVYSGSSGSLSDEQLSSTSIEIRVYP